MLGSKYSPISKKDYGSKDLNIALKGDKFVAAANSVTTKDFLVSDDSLIDGAILIAIGAAFGDKITCQVVDVDNVIGYGAGVVLGQYASNWYMNPNESEQLNFASEYPAKIFGGLYLRIIYTSVGETDVDVIVNYRLHKVLW